MSFLTGDPLPAGSSQSTQQSSGQSTNVSAQSAATQFAPWAEQYLSGLGAEGLKYLGQTGEQLVAPQSALQTMAYESAPDALGRYLSSANAGLAAGQQGVANIQGADINRFYNPYESGVVDEMGRQSALNVQRNLLPQMKAAFAGSGGYGSQRYANATGQALGDVQANLLGQQSQLRQQGWNQALQSALAEKGQQIQGAGVLGNLATAEQNAATSGLKTASELGAQQQAYLQSLIDAPVMRATNVGQILRGYPMQTSLSSGASSGQSTSSSTGQATGTTATPGYAPSGLQQVLQLGTLGASLANGPLGQWVSNTFGSGSNPTPTGYGTTSQYADM
jgi:hypothetical protein